MKTRLSAPILALMLFAASAFAQDYSSFTAPPSCSQPARAGTPVAQNGRLRVQGNRIVNAAGQPVQLRGMSLFWSISRDQRHFYTAAVVQDLATNWGATVIRPAMGIERNFAGDEQGFIADANGNWERTRNVIDGACQAGIYVIIDWHSYVAEATTPHALAFFTRMATLFRTVPNVIYEIYNEPNGWTNPSGAQTTPSGIPVNSGSSWTTVVSGMPGGRSVRDHMQEVTNAIRAIDADNIIMIGTPNWCQRPDIATTPANRITGSNLVYTAHFYSGQNDPTHRLTLKNRIMETMHRGFPVFISEFGLTTADGSTLPSDWKTYSDVWFDFLDENYIGWANWALGNTNQGSGALSGGARSGSTINFPMHQHLTTSGTEIRNRMNTAASRTPNRFFYLTPTIVCEGGNVGEDCGSITSTGGTAFVVERTATNRNVSFMASPAQGWQFSSWSGGVTGTTAINSVALNANMSVTATFVRQAGPPPWQGKWCHAPTAANPTNCDAATEARWNANPSACDFSVRADCEFSLRMPFYCPASIPAFPIPCTERTLAGMVTVPQGCFATAAECLVACAEIEECGGTSVRHNFAPQRTAWQISRVGGSFSLSGPTSATVWIYDLRGRIVRTIAYDAGRQVSLGNLGLSRGNYVISVRDYISGAEVYRGRVSLVR